MVRGEAVAVEMVVFNYGESDVIADVMLDNPGDFLFADFANEIDQGCEFGGRRSAFVCSSFYCCLLCCLFINMS